MGPPTVAIIGAGITGLVTLKNTLEEGFGATAFERRDTIGGVWKCTRNGEDLSVLETTVSNKSRFKNSFTDFPYPKGTPPFPTAP
jgi:dimethylaniline monooxygenase (N-oxide forming)